MALISLHRTTPKRDISESIAIGLVLTLLSYVVGIACGWISGASLNWLEVFAVLTMYSSTYLCVKERRINYPVGVISSAAYAVLFVQNGLFASAVLNAYLVPTLIYGWIRWRKDTNTRPVSRVTLKMIPVYALIAGAGYGGAALISQQLGGAMAWTDSIILTGTILAQFLLDNKKLETWIMWALVDIFAIYTYASAGLSLVAFQYIFLLANTIYGYIIWKRSMQNESLRSTDGNATHNRTFTIAPVRE